MTITIVGGGNSSGPAFPLQRSVRLRSSNSAYFSRTPASAGNRTTWTWSGWVKRGIINSAVVQYFLLGNSSATNDAGSTFIYFFQDGLLRITGFTTIWRQTTQVFRDPSAWYHIVVVWDTTNATALDRVRIYVNGVQVTTFSTTNNPTQNSTGGINAASLTYIGADTYLGPVNYFDGYLTEVNFIDGQALTPASFGSINSTTGVWQPIKYSGTYGTNGFYLNFQNPASTGADSSGNSNNWTPNNIQTSNSALTSYDSMLDVPTLTSATNANFATLNPLNGLNLGSGNLQVTGSGAGDNHVTTIAIPTTGKWYCEMSSTAYNASTIVGWFGVSNAAGLNFSGLLSRVTGAGGAFYQNDVNINAVNIGALNTVFGLAVDRGANTITIYLNNVAQGTVPTLATGVDLFFTYQTYISSTGWVNFGQRPFTYTPPTGFKSLNTYNLPTPTILNGATQFAATTYTGTGSSLAISNTVNGKSFTPDFVWVKGRSGATDHALYDSVRGTTKQLESNATAAETTEATGLTAFDTGGFTVGALAQMNTNTATYVGWQWKAGGTAVTNTSGTISSQVSANPSAGFSIVTYTGTGANATVGHGLGIAPKMFIVKSRLVVRNWQTYHASIGNTGAVYLNTTGATVTASTNWNNTSPTSSVLSLGTDGNVNANTETYVAYCFSEIAGYSRFGSYTGNGSADGVFVYTGFRPRLVMIKGSSFVSNWFIQDSARNGYNVNNGVALRPNLTAAEDGTTAYNIDILSNGFKLRSSAADSNTNGATFMYAAFAENPFNYSLAR